ncbi:hypothetical protein [Brevibacterium moorei]|uniref:hypothetical protein n=1 Tax=Brevibacterium moorei TaxID=2968457 RepID=UPI00211BF343|nr:hypothetical protein [Brevibacterium sp. 68QC2CO]MCQ9385112.1 hypothetical protein [Brevibacterium sp. 68QC2CO]
MQASYVAYWQKGAGDQELLHPDLPISDVQFIRELGVGRLTGKLPAEYASMKNHNGLPVLQEWATGIYVYVDGSFIDAFLIADISDDGYSVTIDCVGWGGYMAGQPWEYSPVRYRNITFETAMRAVAQDRPPSAGWDSGIYAQEGPNAGLAAPAFNGSFPRVGNPEPGQIKAVPAHYPEPKEPKESKAKPKYPTYKKRNFRYPTRSDYKSKAAFDKAVKAYKKKDAAWQKWKKGYDKAVDKYHKDKKAYDSSHKAWLKGPKKKWQEAHAKWKSNETSIKNLNKQNEETRKSAEVILNRRETLDLGSIITSLGEQAGALYKIEHYNIGSTHADHRYRFFAGKVRRNTSVEFIDGENVMVLPTITTREFGGATRITVQGAGDGPDGDVYWTNDQPVNTGRKMGLHRTFTHTDKTLRTSSARQARARTLASVYSARTQVKEIKIINHDDAKFGTYDVGDEVRYRSWDRRGLAVDQWALVEAIAVEPATELVTVTLSIIGEE